MENFKIELDRKIDSVSSEFSIQCSIDFGCPSVLRVTSDSIPYKYGMRVHDLLIEINCLPTETLTHQEAILQIQKSEITLELRKRPKLDSELSPPSPQVEIETFNKGCQKLCSISEKPPPPEVGIYNASYNTSNTNYFLPPTSNTSISKNKSKNISIQNCEPTKFDQNNSRSNFGRKVEKTPEIKLKSENFELLLKSKNNEKKKLEPVVPPNLGNFYQNQSEDAQWNKIKNNCSFMCKTKTVKSCKNEYSISGLCNRTACPLVNYRYTTVIEKDNILYLYIREAERMPWQKLKLMQNEKQDFDLIDQHLINWPAHIIKQVKTRYSNFKDVIKRRQIALKSTKVFIAKSSKVERNERRREMKALKRANVEKSIETDLIENLVKKNRIANLNSEKSVNDNINENESENESEDEDDDTEEEGEFVLETESKEQIKETSRETVLIKRTSKIVIGEDFDDESEDSD